MRHHWVKGRNIFQWFYCMLANWSIENLLTVVPVVVCSVYSIYLPHHLWKFFSYVFNQRDFSKAASMKIACILYLYIYQVLIWRKTAIYILKGLGSQYWNLVKGCWAKIQSGILPVCPARSARWCPAEGGSGHWPWEVTQRCTQPRRSTYGEFP